MAILLWGILLFFYFLQTVSSRNVPESTKKNPWQGGKKSKLSNRSIIFSHFCIVSSLKIKIFERKMEKNERIRTASDNIAKKWQFSISLIRLLGDCHNGRKMRYHRLFSNYLKFFFSVLVALLWLPFPFEYPTQWGKTTNSQKLCSLAHTHTHFSINSLNVLAVHSVHFKTHY